jgi:hypothetical protein
MSTSTHYKNNPNAEPDIPTNGWPPTPFPQRQNPISTKTEDIYNPRPYYTLNRRLPL